MAVTRDPSGGWTPSAVPSRTPGGTVVTGRAEGLWGLLDAANVGLGLFDTGHRFRFVNEPLAAINGVPAHEHLGRTPSEVVPDIAPAVDEIIARVLETGEPSEQEIIGSTAAAPGVRRVWRTAYHLVRDADVGRAVGVVVQEVSDRIEAERVGQTRLNLLDAAEEIAGVGSFVHDLEAGTVTVSRGYSALIGVHPELGEMPENMVLGRVHPDDRAQVLQAVDRIEVVGAVRSLIRVVRDDGTVRWFDVHARLEPRPTGRRPRVHVVVVDVTERRAADALIRSLAARQGSLSRVSAAVARGDDADAVLRLITEELGNSGVRGAAVLRQRAGSARVLHTHGDMPLAPGERVDVRTPGGLGALAAGPGVAELRVQAGAGRADPDAWRIVELENLTYAPIEVEGVPWGGVIVVSDHVPDTVTDLLANDFARLASAGVAVAEARERLRRANAELETRVEERTRELRATVAELGAFSYSVSHDLRGPLRAIHSAAEILEEGGLDDDARDRMIAMVRESAAGMGDLIEDLLRLSRLGSEPLAPERVDMDAELDAVLREADAGQRERARIVRHPLPAVAGSRTLLHQVLANLVGNALKFSALRDAPVVEIGFGVVEGAPDGEASFFVRDNGVGFRQEHAEQAFGLFRRLHADERFEGTGAGLAIVRRVVERHGGTVWAVSAADAGTLLGFTLPLWDGTVPDSAGEGDDDE